ncbi:hypothetical protein B0H67DRAFT_248488 [Lasiosphaeris hirsuta]|uniref:Uncharacterized protein n=1 Tax=Lasiosphaeris hirsuta TaxID=260670 RepID=A0AA40AH68_9PEZI|nr:hypothetical protein B0H67DRAFT_248488 [Lasiosphaeris hirsuta]
MRHTHTHTQQSALGHSLFGTKLACPVVCFTGACLRRRLKVKELQENGGVRNDPQLQHHPRHRDANLARALPLDRDQKQIHQRAAAVSFGKGVVRGEAGCARGLEAGSTTSLGNSTEIFLQSFLEEASSGPSEHIGHSLNMKRGLSALSGENEVEKSGLYFLGGPAAVTPCQMDVRYLRGDARDFFISVTPYSAGLLSMSLAFRLSAEWG